MKLARDLRATLWSVVRRRDRITHLGRLGPRQIGYLIRFVTHVIPRAVDELAHIARAAERIPDAALREQALASIREKAYHVQGGCVLATFLPKASASRYIRIVCALETIYDYLDNLCDRLPHMPVEAYAVMHEALLDAVDLSRVPQNNYFRASSTYDDRGYLAQLVIQVRHNLARTPNYTVAAPYLLASVSLYRDLQSKKHLPLHEREASCRVWFAAHEADLSSLRWYEFAAACGSSLPVFALLAVAEDSNSSPQLAKAIYEAYFPAMSAVHILLDYFIDQAEDLEHDELNFFACYDNEEDALERLTLLMQRTLCLTNGLPNAQRHTFLFTAMRGFYLTHPKIFQQSLEVQSNRLLNVVL
jgi:tetraprenyl-beta-curcumene synthase